MFPCPPCRGREGPRPEVRRGGGPLNSPGERRDHAAGGAHGHEPGEEHGHGGDDGRSGNHGQLAGGPHIDAGEENSHGEAPGHGGKHGHRSEHGHGGEHGPGHRRGLRGLLHAVIAPHSHDAADSIDGALTASAEGIRALKLSLGALFATAALQLVVVLASGSVALLGDTIHNFADALTALPLGVAFWLGRRPPTRRYTYGYGRSEDLAGIFIVGMIALSSAVAAWEAVRRLLHPITVHNLPWVMVAGAVGFAGNELVAVYRIRVGRKIGSAALAADGLHARTDGFTSLAVVIGAIGVALGFRLADPIVGLAITVAILFVLKNAARDIYRRLMDSVDPELVDQVVDILAAVPGVEGVESVRLRWVGHELRAEAEVLSDGGLNLARAHEISEEAHHRLLHQLPRLAEALIHTSPSGDGRDHHAATSHHFPGRR